MRFRALGPVEFFDGQGWLQVGAAKWRALLAVLLIESNRVLSVDRIASELWGDERPKTVANQVHGYVSRLRRLLRDNGKLLATEASGYRLRIGPDDTDLGSFAAGVDRGRAQWRAGRVDEAASLLTDALTLWRGSAFQDVPAGPLVQAEADRLDELRVTVLADLAEINLLRGEHAAVAFELTELVAEHPLRERLRELHMLALYRQGRQADALAVYADIRQRLADELGIDPSPPLQRLHGQILRADPALAAPLRHQDVELNGPALPVHQLPPDVPDFTNRTEQLEAIGNLMSNGSESGPPALAVVVGGPGVGKSALAVHAAHAVSSRFPDGQFYLDLAGTSGSPRDPAVLLAEMLHALGITGRWIPDDLSARATLYRSLLARRRMLLVLDDAARADQVRPLFPSTGSCAVVITSRRQLTDLAGARHVELDVFRPREARQLLATIVGPERVRAEPEEAEAILRSCDYLPLAIRISGGRLVGRTTWPLRILRERLADESRRLSELRVGELGVRASFDLSLQSLPPEAVRAFCLLGLLGAQTVPGWVLAPLLDRPNADEVLDMLVDANLVRLAGIDASHQPRYRLHDLLRAYAVEAAEGIPLHDRREAMFRLLATWLRLVEQAAERLPPSLFRPRPGPAPRRTLPPDTVRRLVGEPLAWFDAERNTLLGAVRLAADWDADELAWELAANLVSYYDLRSLHEDWRQSHHLALGVVRNAGNLAGEAVLCSGLAQVQIYRDALDEATGNLNRSLRLFRELGDRRGEALATSGLGTIERVHGRFDRALELVGQALDLVVELGDQHVEAQLRNGIAGLYLVRGRLAEARTWFGQALELSRQLGDVHREAVVLREMSQLHGESGDVEQALGDLGQALDMFEKLADEQCKAYTLLKMGRLHAERDDAAKTVLALEEAARIFQRNGDRMDEAACWQLLGELGAAHSPTTARGHLTRALHLWQAFSADDQVAEIRTKLDQLKA